MAAGAASAAGQFRGLTGGPELFSLLRKRISSRIANNLTPYWGDWPGQGTQWVELDWSSPVTTNGSDVHFAGDGGGLRLPASWSVRYWNGSAFADVPGPGACTQADNTFNHVSFGSITTTKLRLVMQSGPARWVSSSGSSQASRQLPKHSPTREGRSYEAFE